MNHKQTPPNPNSFTTRIADNNDDNKILAEWFSLNQRSDEERQEIASDIYAVLKVGAPALPSPARKGNN